MYGVRFDLAIGSNESVCRCGPKIQWH